MEVLASAHFPEVTEEGLSPLWWVRYCTSACKLADYIWSLQDSVWTALLQFPFRICGNLSTEGKAHHLMSHRWLVGEPGQAVFRCPDFNPEFQYLSCSGISCSFPPGIYESFLHRRRWNAARSHHCMVVYDLDTLVLIYRMFCKRSISDSFHSKYPPANTFIYTI
jgi:hypothetical protein